MKVVKLETGKEVVLKIARLESYKSIRKFLAENGWGKGLEKSDIERCCKGYWAVDDSSFTDIEVSPEEEETMEWREIECCAIVGATCPRFYFVGAKAMFTENGVFIPEYRYEEVFCFGTLLFVWDIFLLRRSKWTL